MGAELTGRAVRTTAEGRASSPTNNKLKSTLVPTVVLRTCRWYGRAWLRGICEYGYFGHGAFPKANHANQFSTQLTPPAMCLGGAFLINELPVRSRSVFAGSPNPCLVIPFYLRHYHLLQTVRKHQQ